MLLSLGLMYLVRLRVDTAWVPFRPGQMLLVAVPALFARRLHSAYLYVDGVDRQTYPAAAKFDSSPRYFAPVFTRGDVAVYEVK